MKYHCVILTRIEKFNRKEWENNLIINKLELIFRDIFDDNTITLNDSTNSSDIDDWDSLAHIQLISAIEDEFKIKFTLQEAVSAENVGEFIKIIERKLSK